MMADINQLTELRLAYLKEDYGKLDKDDIKKISQDLPGYFKKNHIVYINRLVLQMRYPNIIL